MEYLLSDPFFWGVTYFFYDYRIGYRVEGEVVGAVALSFAGKNNLVVSNLWVQPDFRGLGIGGKLLTECGNLCSKLKCRLLLYVDRNTVDTEFLLGYFRRRGFQEAFLPSAQEWVVAYDIEFDHLFFKECFDQEKKKQ